MATSDAPSPPPLASVCATAKCAGLPAVNNPTPLLAAAAVAANLGGLAPPGPGCKPAPNFFGPSLPSVAAMRRPVPAHPAESFGSVTSVGVASQPPAVQTPAPPPNAPPPAPATESPVPTPAPSVFWSPDDEVAILDALRPRRGRRQDALPHGVDLVMAVFGRLRRTDYSLLDLETKIHALRRRFEENDAALCAGSGGPAPGHDLRLYTLSLDVWGAAVTPTAAPKPAAPAPAPAPAMKKKPAPPAYRGRVTAPAPRRRRYEEMRQQCPNLAGLLEELMKKAMEGVSDIAAWSMELRMKNQQLVGGVAVARADDRVKDLTSLIKRLV